MQMSRYSKLVPKPYFKTWYPYAAAATFLGLILTSYFILNKNSQTDLIAKQNVKVSNETAAPSPVLEDSQPTKRDVVEDKKQIVESTSTKKQKTHTPKLSNKSNTAPQINNTDQEKTAETGADQEIYAEKNEVLEANVIASKTMEEVDDVPAVEKRNEKVQPMSRSKSIPSDDLKDKYVISKSLLDETAVYPLIGKDRLDQLIKNNKNIPNEAFLNNFRGDIEVSFTVNKDGTISDFKNLNTENCYACGEEVIRLLKKSGKWATIPAGIKKETSIKVKF
jgi:outer membrane biosynthesis protein TonB